ncbi:hypothetical protein [Microbacterium lacus]|uniref:SMI1/KNR4 family protein n=1 Tax=Microbacterium lacus TaxID=415217 RepID=A0ABN2GZT9_9MICO
MEADDNHGATTEWPVSSLTPARKRELIARADAVRGLMMDVDPGPWQPEPRIARIGSRELANRFDPDAETAQHVAALLLGLGWSDSKWLHGAGVPTQLVMLLDPLAVDWLSRDYTTDPLDEWAARLGLAFQAATGAVDYDLNSDLDEWFAWDKALAILARRPWLLVTWVKFPDEKGGHLAVHDGAFGAALHFDDPDGPTLGGQSVKPTPLHWEDLAALTDASTSSDEPYVEWDDYWGAPTTEPAETHRLAVLTALRAALSGAGPEANDEYRWNARPAGLASTDWFSAYDLTEVFPTARTAIDLYADMLVGEYESAQRLGGVAYWHEPLWVVHRGNLPVLLFDEAGQVHLPASGWLEQAEDMAILHNPTGEPMGPWSAVSFDVGWLLESAQRWEEQWMAPASAVVGDLLRAGAGYVRAYLGDS